METLRHFLEERCTAVIGSLFPDISLEAMRAELAPCQKQGFGHYQCNSALKLAQLVKKNPREVAKQISEGCSNLQSEEICSSIEVAGPGFINFTFSSAFLSREGMKQLQDPLLGAPAFSHSERVIVEFSSPNIAKELHVGHLRSTIIGDCLARLFEFLGCDVLRLNHIGDWGTQFGMLIAYLEQEQLNAATLDIGQLMQAYRAAKKRFDESSEFKRASQQTVVALQSENPQVLTMWKHICEVSRRSFQEIYELLDVKLVERGESFYNPFLADIIQELKAKELVVESEGAQCMFPEGFLNREGEPLPLMLQKSDGGYTYDTTDMAALRYRTQVDQADRIIVVTDSGQSLHFQMLFKAGEKAGWLKPAEVRVDHVTFGLVLGADGQKFRTRSGDTERLIDLLEEAVTRARQIVEERLPEASPQEIAHMARVIGIGALKYADLASHRTKDYTFSYERMLKFEGNTAVFLLYAYVRINSIFRKVRKEGGSIVLEHPSEIALALHLRRFGEMLEWMVRDLLPNRLTDYLYELAELFNAFFRDCRVEGSLQEASRLTICQWTSKVLKQGLEILGLQVLERM